MVRSRSQGGGGEGGSPAKKEFLGSPPVANTDLAAWSKSVSEPGRVRCE